MLKMYKNKPFIFECRIGFEGSSFEKAKPRLAFFPEKDSRNFFFEGIIEGETCKVPVNPNLDVPKSGKVLLEVIIDNGTLFQPWESTYEIVVDQVKIQSESIKMTFEPIKTTIKIVEDVKIKDDKNKIIEPTKPQVKMVELKKDEPTKIIEDKKPKKVLFLDNVVSSQKDVVNKFLNTVNSLDTIEKKVLLEQITKEYKPNQKAIKWAKGIFAEQNALATKIAMYCYEFENGKLA
jgi:hypothetical protein